MRLNCGGPDDLLVRAAKPQEVSGLILGTTQSGSLHLSLWSLRDLGERVSSFSLS